MRDRWKRFWTSVPGMGLRGAFIWIGLLLYTGAPFSQLTVQATGVMLVGGLVWIERRNPLPDSRAARVFSVLYALAATIGRVLDESNTLASLGSFASLARLGMTFAGLCELVYLLTRRAFRIISRSAETREGLCPPRESGSKGRLLRDWGLIFACWLPCFLSYYPGIFSYDLPAQTQQMMGLRTFTADNPPLHTLVWGLCLRLQEATGLESLAVYGIGQMLLLSFAMAWCISEFRKAGCSRGYLIGSLAFFALNPTIALMSFIPVKDTLFAVFFLLNILLFLRIYREGETQWPAAARWILTALMCCLLRNNAFLMYVLSLPALLILFPAQWKRTVALTALPVMLFAGIHFGLYPAVGIGEGRRKEAMSVPIQQISRIVAEEEEKLSEEELAEIGRYFKPEKAKKNYNPRFADPMKKLFSEKELKKSVPAFLDMWWRLVWKHPATALDALLDLNLPYWYPDAAAVDAYSERIYIETEQANPSDAYFTFERRGWLPEVRAFYEGIADGSFFEKAPVVSTVFTLAFPCWLMGFCFCLMANRRRIREGAFLIPIFAYWVPYLFGPVSNFRYLFPITVLYPVMITVCFGGINRGSRRTG